MKNTSALVNEMLKGKSVRSILESYADYDIGYGYSSDFKLLQRSVDNDKLPGWIVNGASGRNEDEYVELVYDFLEEPVNKPDRSLKAYVHTNHMDAYIVDIKEFMYDTRNLVPLATGLRCQKSVAALKKLLAPYVKKFEKYVNNSVVEGMVLENEKISRFPEKIFILTYPQTNTGYVYTKDYEHEGGGCYYSSKENSSPVDGGFVSLYPDGHLTYLWNGVEKEYKHDWFEIIVK